MSRTYAVPVVALALALALTTAATAGAAPRLLERIIAVVDDKPIFLSELRARARPVLAKLAGDEKRALTEGEVAAAERELLDRIIDERIFAVDPDTRFLEVTTVDVDDAVLAMAKDGKTTPDALYASAAGLGLDRAAFREEIRRQLLDVKWTIAVLRPRVRLPATDSAGFTEALAAERAKERARLRSRHYVEVRP